MWFKRTKFDFLKDVNSHMHEVVEEFGEVDGLYRQKVAAFNRFRDNATSTGFASVRSAVLGIARLLKPETALDLKETRSVSKLVHELEKIIGDDMGRNRTGKQLRYQEYKNLIGLKHLLESYSNIILKQRQLIEHFSAGNFQAKVPEFAALLREEGRILGLEEEQLPALEKETGDLVRSEIASFDVTLIGYGSLMQAKEVAKEVEKTLGRSLSHEEFQVRVVPVPRLRKHSQLWSSV